MCADETPWDEGTSVRPVGSSSGLGDESPSAIDAWALPEPDAARGARLGALARDVIEAVVLAAVMFAVLQFVVQNTVVEGASMAPNFVSGQRLLVNKLAYKRGLPARGDVIVFHAPGGNREDFIKRVVGLPGENVEIRDGVVHVDGQPLEEPWQPVPDHSAFPPYLVPEGHVFVLGDNRANSNDSRTWGAALSVGRIVGRAWLSVWPSERLGLVRSSPSVPSAAAEGR